MIFLPYVFILKNFVQTNSDLSEVQIVHGNLQAIQNNVNSLQSNLQSDPLQIIQFFTNIIGHYLNYRIECDSENAKVPQRWIQITDEQREEVRQNIKDNSLWGLEVCSKGPPDFDTDLYFYRSNVNDSRAYRPYTAFGPTTDRNLPPPLTKGQISQLEYYNSSFHIGSPFWLDYSGTNKINSIFAEHNSSLTKLNMQVTDLSLSSIKTNAINETTLSRTLNSLAKDLTEFRKDLKSLHLRYLEIVPAATKGFNLTTESETPVGEALNKSLIPRIQGVIQVSVNPAFKNFTTTLDEQMSEFEIRINSLNGRLKELEDKKDNASKRLEEIEFPFGSIPINMNESILFFPLGISAGFWISASILGEIIQLRKRYHNLIRKDKTDSITGKVSDVANKQEEENRKEKKKEKKINDHLSLLYPIWVDPTTNLLIRAVKSAILLVPLIIFGASLYFLHDSWNTINYQQEEGLFLGNSREYNLLYIASYIISTIFFFFGYSKIFYELRHYHDKDKEEQTKNLTHTRSYYYDAAYQ
jgi:hypothetical protein